MRAFIVILFLYAVALLCAAAAFGQAPTGDCTPPAIDRSGWYVCYLHHWIRLSEQAAKDEKPGPEPQWTLEPVKHWVPQCPKGFEAWYEPKDDGCDAMFHSGLPSYLDHVIEDVPARDEVECRPIGSQPKMPRPTACAL